MRELRLGRRAFILGALGAAAAATVSYARFSELNDVTVERLEVRLGSSGASLRIAHLSDLHLHGVGPKEEAALRAVEAASPGLIAVTGDHVDAPDGWEPLKEFYSELCGIGPVYAVLGNWDHWAAGRGGPSARQIAGAIEAAGGVVLTNRGIRIESEEASLWLAGVDDPHTGRHDVRSALAEIEGSKEEPVVLLAHSPEVAPDLTGREGLVLCGHTHGGQVRFPLLGPIHVPSRLGRRYVAGLYRVGGAWMYVNRGLGWSFAPLRLNCPPEVTVIDVSL